MLRMDDIAEQIDAFGVELAAFAKTGPKSPEHAAGLRRRLDDLITANAESAESAALTYRRGCEEFLRRVIEARGMPVASVVAVGAAAAHAQSMSVDKVVSDRFDEYLPALRTLLHECVASHASQAPGYFARQRADVERLLAQFVDGIPAGGTKAAVVRSHVNPIKLAVTELLRWGDGLYRLQATRYMLEVDDFLTITAKNPIAMTWRYSPWGCLVPSHKALDGSAYPIRNSWALHKGLMMVSPRGFADEAIKLRRELGCTCHAEFVFHLRSVPRDMVTVAGVDVGDNAAARRESFMSLTEALGVASPPPTVAATTMPRTVSSGFFARLFGRRSES